jgi:hypothetical protein
MTNDEAKRRLERYLSKGRKPADDMAEYEASFRARPASHRMADPHHSDPDTVHINALVPEHESLVIMLRTYRGRMAVNAMLYDPALTCTGCKAKLVEVLSSQVPAGDFN